MVEEKTNGATGKQDCVSTGLLFLLFIGSWILLIFGVVGLYEDRELLSLDTVLAVVGLGLVIFSFPVLLRAVRESEEKESTGLGIGGGSLLAIWGSFKLARAVTSEDKVWWGIGILVLVVISGISQVVMGLRERREATETERSPAAEGPAETDSEDTEPTDE